MARSPRPSACRTIRDGVEERRLRRRATDRCDHENSCMQRYATLGGPELPSRTTSPLSTRIAFPSLDLPSRWRRTS
jgi:hypothetical protein